ncbi:hypothetical protein [Pseudonocardia sp. MH-G8]|uniref:hypothetical protein n=1 Tax=Pseudonocardia sp. MH-G8 TaxID=1854588 RepID=UPI000BA0BE45|nr:hypothetical protein [Pseudonocardia sp. MH-G8]OZM82339.1 hypothetical protein CFP66_11280 [Pseudonocardia sp. MH-G8]
MSAALIQALAQAFAQQPGMAVRLLSRHVDDGSGRCSVCFTGAHAVRQRWPCQIHWYAIQAQALAEESRLRST